MPLKLSIEDLQLLASREKTVLFLLWKRNLSIIYKILELLEKFVKLINISCAHSLVFRLTPGSSLIDQDLNAKALDSILKMSQMSIMLLEHVLKTCKNTLKKVAFVHLVSHAYLEVSKMVFLSSIRQNPQVH